MAEPLRFGNMAVGAEKIVIGAPKFCLIRSQGRFGQLPLGDVLRCTDVDEPIGKLGQALTR